MGLGANVFVGKSISSDDFFQDYSSILVDYFTKSTVVFNVEVQPNTNYA